MVEVYQGNLCLRMMCSPRGFLSPDVVDYPHLVIYIASEEFLLIFLLGFGS